MNNYVSRLGASVKRVGEALQKMDTFADKYLFDPLGEGHYLDSFLYLDLDLDFNIYSYVYLDLRFNLYFILSAFVFKYMRVFCPCTRACARLYPWIFLCVCVCVYERVYSCMCVVCVCVIVRMLLQEYRILILFQKAFFNNCPLYASAEVYKIIFSFFNIIGYLINICNV